jgi:quinol monooxygenase YgiN
MFVVLVSLRVRPDKEEEFLLHMGENARSSLADEAGCLRFDVLQDTADPLHFTLYEIYADDDAFHQDHLSTPHFRTWRSRAADILEPDSQVNRYFRLVDTARG